MIEHEYQAVADLVCRSSSLRDEEKKLFKILVSSHQLPLRRNLLLNNLAYNTRNRYIELLGSVGKRYPKTAIVLLSDLFYDDLLTKQLLCDALGKIGGAEPDLAMNLFRLLGVDSYPVIRICVADSITQLMQDGANSVISHIHRWSLGNSKELREIAARVLVTLEHPNDKDLAAVLRLCTDPFSHVRVEAIRALRQYQHLYSSTVIDALTRAAADSRWSIRKEAAIALETVGARYASKAVSILAKLTLDLIPEVAKQAADSLRAVSHTFPEACVSSLEFLTQDSGILDADVLMTLIEIAGRLSAHHQRRLIPILKRLQQDDDARIRRSAASLLNTMAG